MCGVRCAVLAAVPHSAFLKDVDWARSAPGAHDSWSAASASLWIKEFLTRNGETGRPGVFAVGDVKSGHVKRVASAVGEGSIAVTVTHRALADATPF
jgi:thioredoxin reductase